MSRDALLFAASEPPETTLGGFVAGEPVTLRGYVDRLPAGVSVTGGTLALYRGRPTRPGAVPLATVAATVDRSGAGGEAPVVSALLDAATSALCVEPLRYVVTLTCSDGVPRVVGAGRIRGEPGAAPADAGQGGVPTMDPAELVLLPLAPAP